MSQYPSLGTVKVGGGGFTVKIKTTSTLFLTSPCCNGTGENSWARLDMLPYFLQMAIHLILNSNRCLITHSMIVKWRNIMYTDGIIVITKGDCVLNKTTTRHARHISWNEHNKDLCWWVIPTGAWLLREIQAVNSPPRDLLWNRTIEKLTKVDRRIQSEYKIFQMRSLRSSAC